MKNAIWFSRHKPTPAQVVDMGRMGYRPIAVEDGIRLGSKDLILDIDVEYVVSELTTLALACDADAIFGVWAAPMLGRLWEHATSAVHYGNITCLAAWNVTRSVAGGPPTFDHKRFVVIGMI